MCVCVRISSAGTFLLSITWLMLYPEQGRLVSFDKWSDSKLAFAGVVIPVRRYLPVWRELSTLLLGPR